MERRAVLEDHRAAAPDKPNPAPSTTHTEAQEIFSFFLPGKTPYEFWLTCVILVAGLLFAYLATQFLRQIHRLELENATRAMTILFVIMATMVLITAGYNNEQIAPAFGLFGTIVGYILGRGEKSAQGREGDLAGSTPDRAGSGTGTGTAPDVSPEMPPKPEP